MSVILPGGTIGILGGGQLGRMMTMEAHRMGYRVGVLDPKEKGPASQVADFHVQTEFVTNQRVLDFVADVDVLTLETELIPWEFLANLESIQLTRPSNKVLALIQDRLIQRGFLQDRGFPQTPFASVMDNESLSVAGGKVGFPAILKKRRSGYDGKGQVRVEKADSLRKAWQDLNKVPSILEAVVPFRMELSILLARSEDGKMQLYPLAENIHRNSILHATRAPAQVTSSVQARAQELAVSLAVDLNYCGVMAVELFLLEDETLLINEVAPRPHNSGHFTLGGCITSQFEQHLRAICGLPLGETSLLQPVVMVNLLGDLWGHGSPSWDYILANPYLRLHLYGKDHPQSGRKMGHFLLFETNGPRGLLQAEALLQGLTHTTPP